MKTYPKALVLLAFSALSAQAADFGEVPVAAQRIFVPRGFDANDNSQVVLAGYLPNLCYRTVRSRAEVKDGHIDVKLTALKDLRPGGVCLQATVPFLEVVNIGQVPKGDYEVVVNGGSDFQIASKMSVATPKSSNVDEHIYADVDHIRVKAGSRTVVLEGNLPSSCLAFDRIETISSGKDTYSILPILKRVADICPQQLIPFEQAYEVPTGLTEEVLLLHVRTIKGQSVNALFRQ